MLRRPPGHVAQQRKYLLAFAAILLPWLHVADAQQQQSGQVEQQHYQLGSQSLADDAVEGDLLGPALTASEVLEAPEIRRKNTVSSREAASDDKRKPPHSSYESYLLPEDASAVDTFALDSSVRAPSPPRYRASPATGAGLSSPQTARNLRDWEVEDFVLLATVDGNLHAVDRATGKQRWQLESDQPMVQTTHYRANKSVVDEDYTVVDDFLWVVEPNHDGALYLWVPNRPGAGLVKMGYTMKQMVEELSPHNDKDQNIVYTGDKKTTLVTLDAATGRPIKWFGSGGSLVNELESCLKPNTLVDMDSEECSNRGTITLGRTEYTVGIQRSDGQAIATLKYFEWGPNTFDNDLLQQHQAAIDHRYITSQHDGQVYFFDQNKDQPVFAQKFSSPVARVFEVARPWVGGSAPDIDPELIVLPQPPPPSQDDQVDRMRSRSIFINQTETGSWYAMSGRLYPMILKAPAAKANSLEWWEGHQDREFLDATQLSKALIGTHVLEKHAASKQAPLLTIDDGTQLADWDDGDDNGSLQLSTPIRDHLQPSAIFNEAKKLPEMAAVKVVDLISNPVLILLFVFSLFYYQQDLRRWYKGKRGKSELLESPFDASSDEATPEPASSADSASAETLAHKRTESSPSGAVDPGSVDKADIAVPKAPVTESSSSVTFAEPLEVRERSESISGDLDDGLVNGQAKKKKAHRGRRGGTKHKKANKDKLDTSQSLDDDAVAASVDEVVKKAKTLGEEPKLEPDILTVTNDVEEVSGPILKMGSLEVNTDQQLGTGSNGTVVFAGKWDGRDVAIKRMLIQFNEIASQETKLLRESDDHPNVIRYFAQQQRAAFLYIALELCQASLADVVQKPHLYRELAQAGERDMPGVLYQVANGLSYLHSLRIVHRDLKPQNILVNMGKNGKPRLLVSDFGLCKKLEGGQSSFGATTAHAAGTSGWRAPELLLDDDAPGTGYGSHSAMSDQGSTLHSGSHTSGLVGQELFGPNSRRVTRAIDIFSLGLVFFYVLTKGNHPYDCGDRYMREVNIRKGIFNLQPLDVLGDYAYEARDLITSMLNSNPKARPTAREVMAHPFFWSAKKRLAFLCDVSDHFEKEPRDPPSEALTELEEWAPSTVKGDFLKHLPKEFVDSLGKQRKYTGSRMLDLLRALRNKKNHYEDMPESLKKTIGPLPDGYLGFWTRRFPNLLITCWNVVYNVGWENTDRFKEYYEPAGL
ncbi:hypothetical protein BR93DRAFT_757482 [Coniochaeta sp. PMI_546]|nr:hypothetical protein BR93DRAFT_757482 [Coniochaeta sp. PMI_546]